ncbi:MAG: hypothetical protein ABII64_08565 [Elusimicrobiota bacterium]
MKTKHILYGVLLAMVFALSIFRITDNDVWWHLKTGEYILKNLTIPSTDIFSYTIYGKPWLAFEWLAQTLLYCVYWASGLSGLTVFKALAASLIFFIVLRSCKERNPYINAAIAALAFLVLRDGLRERPQLFTYFFAAAYTYEFRKKTKPLFVIPLMQVFWANMHGPASLIGVGLTALYVMFDEALNAERKAVLFFGTAAAAFITPHGYKIFEYFIIFFRDGFNRLILEYHPPALSVSYIPYCVFLILAGVVFVKLLVDFFSSGGKDTESFRDALIVLFGAAGSLAAIRNIPVFVLISLPAVCGALAGMKDRLKVPGRLHGNPLFPYIFGVVLAAVLWAGAKAFDAAGKYSFGLGDAHRARYAADFMKRNGIKGPLFNDYDIGGYLIWKFYPDEKVFIDGRLVEYGAKFVEQSFYFWNPEIWNKLEKEYGFTAAIIPQESYYSCKVLDERKDWILVYWDDGALIYLKDVPANKKLIKNYGCRFIRPNYPGNCEYLKQYPYWMVREEARLSFNLAPHSLRAKALKDWVYAQERTKTEDGRRKK